MAQMGRRVTNGAKDTRGAIRGLDKCNISSSIIAIIIHLIIITIIIIKTLCQKKHVVLFEKKTR